MRRWRHISGKPHFTDEQIEAFRKAGKAMREMQEKLSLFSQKNAPALENMKGWSSSESIQKIQKILESYREDDDPTKPADASETIKKNTGGRPPATDWPAVKDFLRDEIKKHGFPNPDNPPGWKKKADADRAVRDFIERTQGDEVSDTALRDNVRKILKQLQSEGFRQK